MSRPRLLAILGSGETSPTMVKTHRVLLERVAPSRAVVLDTPFGFQANADELTARAVNYFAESVGHALEPVGLRSAGLADADPVAYERALHAVREAGYVFAGPGSPSYALRHWRATAVPELLADKVRPGGSGGCVVFASAAALTLGTATVPVYEIYKVGEPPAWLEGLDLLGAACGLRAAVIPHFDNAEGGTHDTRFCYLGEERLAKLERDLPEGAFVLGVDEHTGLIFDLDAGRATVVGLGSVTVRDRGTSTSLPAGTDVAIADLQGLAAGSRRPAAGAAPTPAGAAVSTRTLPAVVADAEVRFGDHLAARDAAGAVRVVLDLEGALREWEHETFSGDEMDRARSVLRSMVVRLGEAAETGVKDPAAAVGGFVDALLAERRAARDGGRWDDADRVRDALVGLGVEVRDGPDGTTWQLRATP